MNPFMSDHDLLHAAAERLGIDAEALMRRYYGSLGDALQEMEQLRRTGQLQESFAAMLRLLLDGAAVDTSPVYAMEATEPTMA